jgi:hypothetical protein
MLEVGGGTGVNWKLVMATETGWPFIGAAPWNSHKLMCTCSVELVGTEDELLAHESRASESAVKVTVPGTQVMVMVVTFELGRVIRWRLPGVS